MAGFDTDVSLARAIRRFFAVIRIEKKEVSAIYFYAILSGLIQLSLPLGIQAIINFAQVAAGRGTLPPSMWIHYFGCWRSIDFRNCSGQSNEGG